MNGDRTSAVLTAYIEKQTLVLDDLFGELTAALEHDLKLLGRTKRSAAMIGSIIESYYTCVETMFLRISQYFENQLSSDRWHKDLLEKMTLTIRKVRPRAVSDDVFNDLYELLRFRHFKRYYFSLAYDWERLDEVVTKCLRAHEPLKKDIEKFKIFLAELDTTE
ncbi:MAG: hypothetical protein ACLFRY_03125 [Spirochaetia bacterium]